MNPAFDLVLLGDFRLYGGTTTSAADEIRTLAEAGYRVAIAQVDSHITGRVRPILAPVGELVESGMATRLAPGDKARARLLVVHNARILEYPPASLPEIDAERKVVVVHRAPLDGRGEPIFNISAVHAIAEHALGSGFVWMPVSPVCRDSMERCGAEVPLHDEDWPNIVFPEAWATRRRVPRGKVPVVGRHSRAELEKYPDTREEVLRVYPDDPGVDIRILGVDHRLEALMGGRVPRNWTVWGFGEITPLELVQQIDYFVYFHHSTWLETFGRNVAEALASGALVILPRYLERTFGDAALYCEPGEAMELVHSYRGRGKRYLAQARHGQAEIARRYGPERFLAMARSLIGEPRRASGLVAGVALPDGPVTIDTVPPAPAPPPDGYQDCEVAIVADFTVDDQTSWRIASEIRGQADARFRTVLLHVPSERQPQDATIHPLIQACVAEGLALACDPGATLVRARLVVVHRSDLVFGALPRRIPRVLADKVVVVADRSPLAPTTRFDHLQRHHTIRSLFGVEPRWAPVSPEIRQALNADGRVPLESSDWSLAIHPGGSLTRLDVRRPSPVIGRLAYPLAGQWPASADEALAPYPPQGTAVVRLLGVPTLGRLPFDPAEQGWQTCTTAEMSILKFLAGLDLIVHYPGDDDARMPEAAMVWAMLNGTVPVLPPSLKARFGEGPIYADASRAGELVQRLWSDPSQLASLRAAVAETVRRRFGIAHHIGRLQKLLGPVAAERGAPRRPPSRHRVLFLTSNGTGLGHVTRLLAVARRCPSDVEPFFVTLSQAIGAIEQCGYPVEYVPSPIYADVDGRHWNAWFAQRLRQIVAYYRPRAVVFDGSSTYEGLSMAVAPDPACRMIWIRRAMWRHEQDNRAVIDRQKHFDLVIEPGDIADAVDRGETTRHRHMVVQADPIRLLDDHELIDRAQARARLGLDPDRPAVLIQVGSGSNRDIATIIDNVLAGCSRHPELQPVIAEWLISSRPLDYWPGVRRLRGYPNSRYFNAFDFTVSATGYNSFNEIISLGLPAIFVANEHMEMDDQEARARYAEAQGAAFHVGEHHIEEIGEYIDAMMAESTRSLLRFNALRIARPNGAHRAAELVACALHDG